jgi:hypothetical protein
MRHSKQEDLKLKPLHQILINAQAPTIRYDIIGRAYLVVSNENNHMTG